jgi:hypothetical protein
MSSNNSGNSHSSGGLGIPTVLFLIFFVLKLCGVINWSWIWVFSPLWIGAILYLLITIVMFIVILIKQDAERQLKEIETEMKTGEKKQMKKKKHYPIINIILMIMWVIYGVLTVTTDMSINKWQHILLLVLYVIEVFTNGIYRMEIRGE